jgi:hypothetical protein
MTKAKKKNGPKRQVTDRQLKALDRKYKNLLRDSEKNEEERLRLAQQLYEIAIQSEGSELHVVERKLDQPKAKPQTRSYKLTDPEAALLMMNRFCNVWIPLPIVFCMALGCPGIQFPPGRFCFLINCALDVCTLANGRAGLLRCVYLCVRLGP